MSFQRRNIDTKQDRSQARRFEQVGKHLQEYVQLDTYDKQHTCWKNQPRKMVMETNKYFVHCKCRYILSSHQEKKKKEKSPSNQNNYFSSMIFNYIAAIFCCYSLMGNHSPSLLRVSLFRHHLLASPNQPFLHFLCSSHEHNLDFQKTNKKRARERKWKGQDEEIEGVLKQNKSLPLRGK